MLRLILQQALLLRKSEHCLKMWLERVWCAKRVSFFLEKTCLDIFGPAKKYLTIWKNLLPRCANGLPPYLQNQFFITRNELIIVKLVGGVLAKNWQAKF